MDVTKKFANVSLENEGVWLDYRDGSKVKLTRLGNARFQRIFDAKMRPHQAAKRGNRLATDVETSVLCACIAEAILVDWEGFEKDGKKLKYTAEAAKELLIAHIDFRNEIVEMASAEENFRTDYMEDSAGN